MDTVPNLEHDMKQSQWFCEKVRARDDYAQNIYAALCNNEFQKNSVWPILKDQTWSCSWRYAGGIVAEIQGHGDYLDWYCSGIGFHDKSGEMTQGYVPESMITQEVEQDLSRLGWIPIEQDHAA